VNLCSRYFQPIYTFHQNSYHHLASTTISNKVLFFIHIFFVQLSVFWSNCFTKCGRLLLLLLAGLLLLFKGFITLVTIVFSSSGICFIFLFFSFRFWLIQKNVLNSSLSHCIEVFLHFDNNSTKSSRSKTFIFSTYFRLKFLLLDL
jgi:hypothetical protein